MKVLGDKLIVGEMRVFTTFFRVRIARCKAAFKKITLADNDITQKESNIFALLGDFVFNLKSSIFMRSV